MYETKEQPATLKAAVDSLGLTYAAEFVPFSKSRNAKPAQRPSDLSINWRITIGNGRQTLTTDYMQGIAHVPGFKQSSFGRMTVDEFDWLKRVCETGKYGRFSIIKLSAPALHEVLWALLMDASAIDSATFDEWAGEYGYDFDSREAERIYKACIEIGLKLRAMLGDSSLSELREAAQDY